VPTTGLTLWATLGDLGEWGRYYLDSTVTSFGPLWPVAVAVAVVGSAVACLRARGVQRLTAGAALTGLLLFPFMPTTGELAFVNNLRYGIPALALGLVTTVVAIAPHRRARVAATVIAVAVIVADLTSPHRGRVPAWPAEPGWAVGGALLTVVIVGLVLAWPRLAGHTPHLGVMAIGSAMVVVLVVAVIELPAAERAYLDGRYDDPALEDAALYAAIPDDGPVRVDVLNSLEVYPFFGPSLQNEVAVWNEDLARPGSARCDVVRGWMAGPFAGDIGRGYVIAGRAWLMRLISPDERREWFESDPAVAVVSDDGAEAVYSRTGPLDPSSCEPPG
jgi:hypothetical protein